MTTRTAPTPTQNWYSRRAILSTLRTVETNMLEQLKTHEERIEEWRAASKEKLAVIATRIDDYKDGDYWSTIDSLRPPERTKACADHRIMAMNKAISRLESMSGDDPKDSDRVKLRRDDPIFEFIGAEACL